MSEVSYKLKKSFGYIENHEHKHVPAGTVLVVGKDDALISRAFRAGANIEAVEAEEAPKDDDKKSDDKKADSKAKK